MDLDNIQRKYGLPAPLPVVQNGKFATRFPLNLEHRGDDVFQFGGKYIGEIENIYDLLYKILTNQEIDASLALPYAIKITEDKLYIRDKTNSEWILIFDITKPNFPKEIELYELIYKAITHQVIGEDTSYPGQFKIEENILYVRDKDNLIWTQIGDVTKEFLGATEATQAILEQINEILIEVQELKTELNRQIATTNETLTTALQAANEAMTSAKSINIRTFNSVEEMKASNTLKAGALAKTQGFYQPGDGGGADYVIVDDIDEDEADEINIITLKNELYAKYMEYISYKQNFGHAIDFHKSFSINAHWFPDNIVNTIAEAKPFMIRIDATWSQIETTKGVYNFANLDTTINKLRSKNLNVLLIFGKSNSLYGTGTLLTNNTLLNGYLSFVEATVNHYKGMIYAYDVLNEPDNIGNWDAARLTNEVCKPVYETIKRIDENAKVCFLSILTTSIYILVFIQIAIQSGLLNYCDCISVHPYGFTKPEDEDIIFTRLHALIKAYTNNNIPIWVTETGYSTASNVIGNDSRAVTEETRSKYVPRVLFNNLANGVENTVIYTATTSEADVNNLEDFFGIINPYTGEGYQTYDALKTWSLKLEKYSYVGIYWKTDTAKILGFVNKKAPNLILLVGWSTQTQEQISINGINYNLTDTVTEIDTIHYSDFLAFAYQNTTDDFFIQKTNAMLNANVNSIFNNTEFSIIAGANNSISDSSYSINMGYYSSIFNGDCAVCEASSSYALGKCPVVFGSNNISAGSLSYGAQNFSARTDNKIRTIQSYTSSSITIDDVSNLTVDDKLVLTGLYVSPILAQVTSISGNSVSLKIYGSTAISSSHKKAYKMEFSDTSYSTVIGHNNTNTGKFSLVGGESNESYADVTTIFGNGNYATSKYETIMGCNATITSEDSQSLFKVGNGASIYSRSNALRLTPTGDLYIAGSLHATGADYAEFFEWLDGNENNEDRTGYFVTLEGDKIKKSTTDSEYILGVVSVKPSIAGNAQDDQWQGMYEKDEWGRIIYENVDGEKKPKINSKYDNDKTYIPRSERKEWSIVGMLGVLLVRDDGSCVINGYCKPNINGIATKSDIGYRVIGRVSENIVKIIFK